MATMAEGRMNLAALQQRDPYITRIVDTASHVALYSFSATTNEWIMAWCRLGDKPLSEAMKEKTEIEGTLFVYSRSASPINGFMILNRLGLVDQIEPLNKDLEFQLQDPFLLYRNGQAEIFGIWFYDKDQCARIGQLLNSLVQVAVHAQEKKDTRQRRASESDSMEERMPAIGKAKNVDIMQMLSQAQHEYDKSKAGGEAGPKPMIDNPNASAMKSSTLIKPLARKFTDTPDGLEPEGAVGGATTPTTQISLDVLFQRAGTMQTSIADVVTSSGAVLARSQSMSESRGHARPAGKPDASGMPPLLQKLMSHPASTVQEIERQQREGIPRDQMPQPAGAEAPAKSSTHPQVAPSTRPPSDRESPNTVLMRTLNILPSSTKTTPVKSGVLDTSVPVTPQALKMSSSGSSLAGLAAMKVKQEGGVESLTNQLAALNQPANQASAAPSSANQLPGLSSSGSANQLLSLSSSGSFLQGLVTTKPAEEDSRSKVGGDGRSSSRGPPPLVMPGTPAQGPPPPTSSLLLTPQAFSHMSTTPPLFPPPAATHLPQPTVLSAQGGGDAGRLSAGGSQPMPQGASSSDSHLRVAPLTREQLQQAMLYLLHNDPDFTKTLHEAYIKSLNFDFGLGHRS